MGFGRHLSGLVKVGHFSRASLISFWVIAGLFAGEELFSTAYDWDIDHEIYFGHELLSGRLIWTREFHDKLPLVQFFFSIVDLLGGVWAWRLVSLAIILAVSIYVSNALVPDRELLDRYSGRRLLAIQFIAPLTLLLSALLPGGFTHINAIAAESALLSIFLLRDSQTADNLRSFAFFFLGASLSGAVAISFRPYFLPPLLVALLLISLFSFHQESRNYINSRFAFAALTVLAVGLFGVLINFLPYFLSGNLAAAFDGLRTLLEINNPRSAVGSLREQLGEGWLRAGVTIGILTSVLLALTVFIYSSSKKNISSMEYFVVPAIIFSLFATILLQHWWPHYANLFTPFIGVLIPFLTVDILSKLPNFRGQVWNMARVQYVRGRLEGLVFGIIVGSLTFILHTQDGPFASNNPFVEELTKIHRSEGSLPPFVVPEDMATHNEFNEPRHGLPHAANTQQILDGWFAEVQSGNDFAIPTSLGEYCKLLAISGAKLVLLSEGSELNECFGDHGQQELLTWTEGDSTSGIKVYRAHTTSFAN